MVVFGGNELSDLELTSDSMSKAIQAGKASGRRLKRVLLKALAGKKINVVIVGGSNSAGGKLGVHEISRRCLFLYQVHVFRISVTGMSFLNFYHIL